MAMFRLPASLERRLKEMFPTARERERFIVDTLEEGMTVLTVGDEDLPEQVGGTLHLFTDGGSRGNPGEAAIGCILEDPARGITLEQHAERIGVETNNVAEYRALVKGLELAERYHPNRLICHLDSELIVKQLNGEYRVKMATLQPFFDEIKERSLRFADIVFRYIPRGDNYRADALVNKALDQHPAPTYRPQTRGNPTLEI